MAFVLTYETLFDLLRKEKSREDLQSLPEGFYSQVSAFLGEKRGLVTAATGAAAQRASIEFENTKKILKELYERRERKLLFLALNKARTESAIIDPSILLPEERPLFDTVVTELQGSKSRVLDAVLATEAVAPPAEQAPAKTSAEPPKTAKQPMPAETAPTKKVKFLAAVPKFVDKAMQPHGPFKEGEEAELPAQIADILIRKKRVELA